MTRGTINSNQYYGGMNRRFENRANLLKRLGFAYQTICRNTGAFVRGKTCNGEPVACIPAAVLQFADNRGWFDVLSCNLRRR